VNRYEAAVRPLGFAGEEMRVVRIPNTIHLEHAYLSENRVDEALENGNVEVVCDAASAEVIETAALIP
jgi:Fe-S cluster assembly iron-binding protein IscA